MTTGTGTTLVVVLGASSSVEQDEEGSDEDEVDAALLLRFLFLFLCVGGFVTAGGILLYESASSMDLLYISLLRIMYKYGDKYLGQLIQDNIFCISSAAVSFVRVNGYAKFFLNAKYFDTSPAEY